MAKIHNQNLQNLSYVTNELSKEECDVISALIGNNCKKLIICLAELYLNKSPNYTEWNTGLKVIACFYKDNAKNTYFLKCFEYERYGIILEEEWHCIFDYECQTENFHKFKVKKKDYTVGLKFFKVDDAKNFRDKISEKFTPKDETGILRKIRSRSSYAEATETPIIASSLTRSFSLLALNKKQLKTSDISAPTNFTHIQHKSYKNDFNLFNNDPKLKVFLTLAEISKDDWETESFPRYFIYEIIDKHGGIDAAIENFQKPPSMPTISATIGSYKDLSSNKPFVPPKKPLPPVPPKRTVTFLPNNLTKPMPFVVKPSLPPRTQSSKVTAPPIPPRKLLPSPSPKVRSIISPNSIKHKDSEVQAADKTPKYINYMNKIVEEK